MDIKRMRQCAPMLPEPGDSVVIQCLDEIDRLRSVLEEISNPIHFMQKRAEESGYRLSGQAYSISEDSNYLKEIAKKALAVK